MFKFYMINNFDLAMYEFYLVVWFIILYQSCCFYSTILALVVILVLISITLFGYCLDP